jgi:hypothetical protein
VARRTTSALGTHLLYLDAGQMRKELLDGITPPNNDSSSGIHHTVRARAQDNGLLAPEPDVVGFATSTTSDRAIPAWVRQI